ncbi:CHAT domain-containing protein [Mycena rosella]|uniref:CHAT domain-containing protein n=1 Tax=Mycena rosella TaxID=1033263 RepID=A0AAD7D1D6_MYCRO|nr:CHAT domain-containing protein [Mycena rosella]
MLGTTLSSLWTSQDVRDLLDHLKAERIAEDRPATERITGFVAAVITASTLSTAWGITRDPIYRNEGREVYRHTLGSLREILPLDSILDLISSMDFFGQLKAFSFMTDGFIPFIVQLMALLMQRVVEIPLSAVVGRRAAALAMDKGFYQQGTEWLEQCLMLVWGQLNLRAPAPLDATRIKGVQGESELEGRMGQIVVAFLGLCIHVDLVADVGASLAHPEQVAYFLIEEWLKLRTEVYSNPIYKDLFKPHPFRHILHAARTAPVVMINLWGSQCDALVIRGEGNLDCIRLDGVTEEFAATLQSDFREGLQSHHFRSRGDEISETSDARGLSSAPRLHTIHRVLAALWRKVVKPILDKMGLKPVENYELDTPRLTWCLTGPTSFFPLHAAGLYDTREPGSKTYEYVASSYTPTLSILADAHDTLSENPEPFKGILAVSQPNMDGQTPIPKTVDEVKALIEAVNDTVKIQWLNGAEATTEAVLSGMASSTWVHLACHAHQYPLRSSESAFILANGDTLSLADISARVSGDGELAFLSACQTAAGDFDLSEEGVHLAAGMLVAGYRSVIATTWSVRDKDAPVVAGAVYKMLLAGGQVQRTGTALALHHATRLLREQVGEENVMLWAPFIHLGI